MRLKKGRFITEWVLNSVLNKTEQRIDRERSEYPYPSTTGFKVVSAQVTQILAGVSSKWFKWEQVMIAELSETALSDTLMFYDGGSGGSALATAFGLTIRTVNQQSASGIDQRVIDIKGQYIVSSLWCSTTLGRVGIKVGGILMTSMV